MAHHRRNIATSVGRLRRKRGTTREHRALRRRSTRSKGRGARRMHQARADPAEPAVLSAKSRALSRRSTCTRSRSHLTAGRSRRKRPSDRENNESSRRSTLLRSRPRLTACRSRRNRGSIPKDRLLSRRSTLSRSLPRLTSGRSRRKRASAGETSRAQPVDRDENADRPAKIASSVAVRPARTVAAPVDCRSIATKPRTDPRKSRAPSPFDPLERSRPPGDSPSPSRSR
jgi:hypothetical protein